MKRQEHEEGIVRQDRVWVSVKDRIASFHEVEEYKLEAFQCHDTFLKYIHTLQEEGFRFQ